MLYLSVDNAAATKIPKSQRHVIFAPYEKLKKQKKKKKEHLCDVHNFHSNSINQSKLFGRD
jgi:hypothetical protein